MELAVSAFAVFVFCAIIGSFLNVVIYRVPAGESVISPGSHCPECGTPIRWYDNIPIASWMILGGKCRACGSSISVRYPLIEALTGMLGAMLWIKLASKPLSEDVPFTSLSPTGLFVIFGLYFTFIVLCIIIAFIDLDTVEIPFRFSLAGVLLGVASPFLVTQYITDPRLYLIEGGHWPPVLPTHSVIGALLGAGAVLALIIIYYAARGVPGMGGGDVPLMAMVGAWLGWPAILFVFFASSIQALLATGLIYTFGDGEDFFFDANELFEDDDEHTEAERDDEEHSHAAAHDLDEVDAPAAEEDDEGGLIAIPYGPFITLAAVEHLLFGDLLPSSISLAYLYTLL
ncbi:MAG: prepilin peptidase [Myxococcota bacterium]